MEAGGEREGRQEASKEQSTWASSGVPKVNNLKCTFCKLWTAYKKPLKLYVQAEREAEDVVHCTPLLFLQLTGLRAQDQVHWGNYVRFESNCPVCEHASTMPMRLLDKINANDAHLRNAAGANGGDRKFVATENKVGCYCYDQKCFGEESGIGCSWCVELATEKSDVPDEVEPTSEGVLVKQHLTKVSVTKSLS